MLDTAGASTIHSEQFVTEELLRDLPEPVQRYMNHTGVVGKPWPNTVHLKQVGRFRTGPERPWMAMTAKQTYTTNPPGFVWDARFKVMGLPLLRARDEYKLGQANMFAKLAGLFTIFDVRGEELNQGAMLRYLSEMIWFPAALLGDNISWQEVDRYSAQVQFMDKGNTVSGTMFIDEEGRVTNFTTFRYREMDGRFSLDPWSTPVTEYGRRAGLNLPIRGQAVWNLVSGDFPYVELEITEIAYNLSE
jgi:hypothetical protein